MFEKSGRIDQIRAAKTKRAWPRCSGAGSKKIVTL